MENQNYYSSYFDLLVKIKKTIEGLLCLPNTNVWNMYGGLDRLANCLQHIFQHGLKEGCNYWSFVRELRLANPVLGPFLDQIIRESDYSRQDIGLCWLQKSLESLNLSSQLILLLRNYLLASKFYYEYAFLRQNHYFLALITCLKAVEQNKASFLADVNPQAMLKMNKVFKPGHCRSNSLPITRLCFAENTSKTHVCYLSNVPRFDISHKDISNLYLNNYVANNCDTQKQEQYFLDQDKFTNKKELKLSLKNNHGIINYEQNVLLTPNLNNHLSDNNQTITSSLGTSIVSSLSNIYENNYNSNYDNIDDVNEKCTHDDIYKYILEQSRGHQMGDQNLYCQSPEFNYDYKESNDEMNDETPDCTYISKECKYLDRDCGNLAIFNDLKNEEILNTDNSVKFNSQNRLRSKIKLEVDYQSENFYEIAKDVTDDGIKCELNSITYPVKIKEKVSGHLRSTSDVTSILSMDIYDSNNLSSSCPQKEISFLNRGPMKDESLINFLQSRDLKHFTDIDRENAHFYIAETMLSAIEQIKWNIFMKMNTEPFGTILPTDQLNVSYSPQRIRCRQTFNKNLRMIERNNEIECSITSNYPFSTNNISTCEGSDSENSESTLDIDFNDMPSSNLLTIQQTGLTLSLASLYTDSDLKRTRNLSCEVDFYNSSISKECSATKLKSADEIAICLLKRFSAEHMPKASELDWVVTEEDVTQKLLPLPDCRPVSPKDFADMVPANSKYRFRGNLDWAPPRQQIIYTVLTKPKLSEGIAKQNYRCAGCGSKIKEPDLAKRYRYCEYLGKYFCICCHDNETSVIPARILRNWDFRKYAVSHFAADFLKRINDNVLFSCEVTHRLYDKVKALKKVRDLRLQLGFLAAFILTCQSSERPLNVIAKCPPHWYNNDSLHKYSIQEFEQIKKNELYALIKTQVDSCIHHVKNCKLCRVRGFICEFCNNEKDIIFPFEISRVFVCHACSATYHKNCFKINLCKCPKCQRIYLRKSKSVDVDDIQN